jgi:2,3-bisphosphoglycerate-independent phosphoglycerate mutase
MDRDNNWQLTQTAYDLLVNGKGEEAENLILKLQEYYNQEIFDTKIMPIVLDPAGRIKDNDAVIFFNYREDSMRQISRAFVEPFDFAQGKPKFDKFPRNEFKNIYVTLMTQYLEEPGLNLNVAFPLPEINNGLAEVLSTAGKKQLHIAETEKYAHATYFFNCLRNTPFEGESDILIESYKKHIEHPEMRSKEIADALVSELAKDMYDFAIVNIANGDILAHAGTLEGTIAGIGHVDTAVGRIMQAVKEKGGILLITADHGNSESLVYKGTGDIETKHNLNPVPFYLVATEYERPETGPGLTDQTKVNGLISDVAATVLEFMNIEKPVEMTGDSLLSQIRQ